MLINFKKKLSTSIIVYLLLIQFVFSQNVNVEPVCNSNSIEYPILVNLKDYLEKEKNIDGRELYSNINDLKSKQVGTYENVSFDGFTNTKVYTKYDDMMNGLRKHEVDAIIIDSSIANYTRVINNDLSLLEGQLDGALIGYACQKNSDFFTEFNAYLESHNEDIWNSHYKWMGISFDDKTIDTNLPSGSKVIKAMFTFEYPPFCFKNENGEFVGGQIEILYNFAREKGYTIDLKEGSTQETYNALKNGEIDVTSLLMTDKLKNEFSFPIIPDIYFESIIRYSNSQKSASFGGINDKIEDFNGENLGCLNGFSFESLYEKYFKDSTKVYKPNNFDLLYELLTGKIEGFLTDRNIAKSFVDNFPEKITYYEVNDDEIKNELGFGFKKGSDLISEFNTFLEDVDKDKLFEKWDVEDDSNLSVEKDNYTGTKTIKAGFYAETKPLSYYSNGELKGYEIDLLYQFAKSKNYNIDFEEVKDIEERLNVDKYEITGGSLTITEERRQKVAFSDPIHSVGISLAVRTDSKKDTVKLSIYDEKYNKISDNKATINLGVGNAILESACTFPDKYNETITLNCKISDLKGIDPYTQGITSTYTTDKLSVLNTELEINNLLKANSLLNSVIITESDKSNAICSKENTAEEDNITRIESAWNIRFNIYSICFIFFMFFK